MELLGLRRENGGYRKIANIPLQSSVCVEDSDFSGFVEEDFSASHSAGELNDTSKNSTMAYTRRHISQLEGDMKLSIRKMDGTTFDVIVAGTATVQDLKAAVENQFDRWQFSEGQISWQHVWENFCLCYSDQKLTDDGVLLHHLGMKKDDQLHFVRHLATRRPGEKSHSRKRRFFYGLIKKGA